ncbi:serine hydrolase domain-containing protein [Streptosporangium lutulentum]
MPSLLQVMNGEGNSPKIELTTDPGAQYHYSGAGFVLLQRMVEELTGGPLTDYMRQEVLAPLGMTSSSYALSPAFELASGHTTAGAVIPGGRNRYPSRPPLPVHDRAGPVPPGVVPQSGLDRHRGHRGPLDRSSARTLLTEGPQPGMGRGLFVAGSGTRDFSYTHDGSNYGFKSVFKGYPELGAGYAVLANGNNTALVNEVAAAVRSVYGWS